MLLIFSNLLDNRQAVYISRGAGLDSLSLPVSTNTWSTFTDGRNIPLLNSSSLLERANVGTNGAGCEGSYLTFSMALLLYNWNKYVHSA